MNTNSLCKGCMSEKHTTQNKCLLCGFSNDEYQAPLHHLPLNTILNGKYLLGKVLGEGGFGITYLGWDLLLDLKIAIKEYYPATAVTRDHNNTKTVSAFSNGGLEFYTKGKEKFIDEAKSLAKFYSLPSIVSVKDYFPENGTAYIVMEFIDGVTLKDHLAQLGGTLSSEYIFELMKPLVRSLMQVHKAGMIHRDISPDNIMIDDSGNIKLLDFGAARDFTNNGGSLSILLKPGYAPEEQYRTHGNQGPWTDVYALCATMYRAIVGQPPMESLERLREDKLISPSKLGIAISPSQEFSLMKGLSPFAQDRWQDMEQLAQAIYPKTVSKASASQPPTVSSTPPQEKPVKKKKESTTPKNALDINKLIATVGMRIKKIPINIVGMVCAVVVFGFLGVELLQQEPYINVAIEDVVSSSSSEQTVDEQSESKTEPKKIETTVSKSIPESPKAESVVPESEPEPVNVQGIVWEDKEFEKCIRLALDKPTGVITVGELDYIEKLQIGFNVLSVNDNYIGNLGVDSKLKNLEDIKNFTNLTELRLFDNLITDITPLSNLTNLTHLSLSWNLITDITPLSNLTNLTYLDLSGNQFKHIIPLANLKNLTELSLVHNEITDISLLEDFTNLTGLWLNNNPITDLSPLANLTNLTGLGLDDNLITDLSPLANLTNLTELRLARNHISDTTPLENLTNLEILYLDDNQITHVTPLSNLTNLDQLTLGNNKISDITPLSNLVDTDTLRRLNITLKSLQIELKTIQAELESYNNSNLASDQLSDYTLSENTSIETMSNIVPLGMAAGQARKFLLEYPLMETLANIEMIREAIALLTNLTFLDLSNNKITDISSLANLVNLADLDLQDNQISDITPLSNLTKLESLNLKNNQIIDFSPLDSLPDTVSIVR